MSWGHILSKDLLTWKQASAEPALVPDQEYDQKGVFTGCWIPTVGSTDKTLRVVYSSVKQLPFHWSAPPYPRDAAGIAMAVSYDNGNSWKKMGQNPMLEGEPPNFLVTGFRDPYAAPWTLLDHVRDRPEPALYGLVSGGIEGAGPTTFLYEIQDGGVGDWKYIGPLVDIPQRFQPSKKWCGNFGMNWECTNFMTLRTESDARSFLIIGAEGDVEKDHVHGYEQGNKQLRTIRSQLWMSGSLTRTNNGVRFVFEHGGYLDHGPSYAANSFEDPVSGRRIVYGWIPEEDILPETARLKGWNGSLAIPRELFLLQIPNVQESPEYALSEMVCFESRTEKDGSTTLLTLGVRPIAEIARLRKGCGQKLKAETGMTLPILDAAVRRPLFETLSTVWELEATISIEQDCRTAGFHIRHDQDLSICTSVEFSHEAQTISVIREESNSDSTITKCPDAGPFNLFFLGSKSDTDEPQHEARSLGMEKLHLRIFSDGDILEVFANDRFALATMVYSGSAGKNMGYISAFATGGVNSASFENVTVWDGLNGGRTLFLNEA